VSSITFVGVAEQTFAEGVARYTVLDLLDPLVPLLLSYGLQALLRQGAAGEI
jgi:hypothetical protein